MQTTCGIHLGCLWHSMGSFGFGAAQCWLMQLCVPSRLWSISSFTQVSAPTWHRCRCKHGLSPEWSRRRKQVKLSGIKQKSLNENNCALTFDVMSVSQCVGMFWLGPVLSISICRLPLTVSFGCVSTKWGWREKALRDVASGRLLIRLRQMHVCMLRCVCAWTHGTVLLRKIMSEEQRANEGNGERKRVFEGSRWRIGNDSVFFVCVCVCVYFTERQLKEELWFLTHLSSAWYCVPHHL